MTVCKKICSILAGRRLIACVGILGILPIIAFAVRAQSQDQLPANCGTLRGAGQYGPYDYRTATVEQKSLVEGAHFKKEYAAYLRGNWVFSAGMHHNAPIAGGFDYTLRAFPNHHRTLKAMEDMGMRRKMERLPAANFSVECYFLRAINFVPDDGLVRALYGTYLARRGRSEPARVHLLEAIRLAPDSLNVRSHVAFSYIEIGDWSEAEKHARVAYQSGYELPGLRDRLKAKGHWSE